MIYSTKAKHKRELENLFKSLIKCGVQMSPHKCQIFRTKLVYSGRNFMVCTSELCYVSMKKNCHVIHNTQLPKLVKQCREICGMLNFLSSVLKDLCKQPVSLYYIQKENRRLSAHSYATNYSIHSNNYWSAHLSLECMNDNIIEGFC